MIILIPILLILYAALIVGALVSDIVRTIKNDLH